MNGSHCSSRAQNVISEHQTHTLSVDTFTENSACRLLDFCEVTMNSDGDREKKCVWNSLLQPNLHLLYLALIRLSF